MTRPSDLKYFLPGPLQENVCSSWFRIKANLPPIHSFRQELLQPVHPQARACPLPVTLRQEHLPKPSTFRQEHLPSLPPSGRAHTIQA